MTGKGFITAILFLSVCIAASAQTDSLGLRTEVLDSAKVVDGIPMVSRGNIYSYSVEKSASVISVVGEPDVVRQMAVLPGVAMGMEGSLGLFVRGGNSSNCRLQVDGVPLYNATHAFGLMSSLQPESLSGSKIYTGGFKSSHGNFTSGVVDATFKSGPVESAGASVTFSPYIDGIYIETPGRLALRIGARYSPVYELGGYVIDNFKDRLEILSDLEEDFGIKGRMYDVNAQAIFHASERIRIKAVGFAARDFLDVAEERFRVHTGWQTWMGKAGLEMDLGGSSRLDLTLYASHSASEEGQESYDDKGKVYSSVSLDNAVLDVTARAALTHTFAKRFGFNGGVELRHMLSGTSLSAFTDIDTYLGPKVDLSVGLRPTLYMSNAVTRANLDAHVLADVNLSDRVGLEFTFDRMNQYFHVLEGLPTGWSLDLSVPIESAYPEETSNQLYAGVFTRFRTKELSYPGTMDINFNVGAYFKDMSNMVGYVSSVNLLRNKTDNWQTDTDCGAGRSFGLETSLLLNSEKMSANLSYTLSHTDRQFPMINGGMRFPFKFDRPHILNVQLDMTTVDRRSRGGGCHVRHHAIGDLALYSGSRMTVAVSQYEAVLFPYGWEADYRHRDHQELILFNLFNRTEMTGMNAFRTPAYFRLDIGYAFEFRREKATHELALTVYNMLNRHNPYMIYNDLGTWKQISILPILPSFRWKVSLGV